jgi:hypothetical protein
MVGTHYNDEIICEEENTYSRSRKSKRDNIGSTPFDNSGVSAVAGSEDLFKW